MIEHVTAPANSGKKPLLGKKQEAQKEFFSLKALLIIK